MVLTTRGTSLSVAVEKSNFCSNMECLLSRFRSRKGLRFKIRLPRFARRLPYCNEKSPLRLGCVGNQARRALRSPGKGIFFIYATDIALRILSGLCAGL